MQPFNIPGQLLPLSVLAPAADAAGRTGAVYHDLGKYHKVFAVFHITQGNAATVACSLSKADDAAGTGAAAVTETFDIYTNLDVAAGDAFTRQPAAASFTTDAGVKNKIVVVEVDPAKLSKRFLSATTGASNAANITSAMFYGIPRDQRV